MEEINADKSSSQAANAHPRRKRGSFDGINNVLNKLVAKLGLEHRLKEHALMGLWPVVAGHSFAQNSRPLFLDTEGFLVVTVKNSAVAQELMLKKRDLLRQLQHAANSLGLTIKGLRFDLKHYYGSAMNAALEASLNVKPLPDPTNLELQAINLNTEELRELAVISQHLRDAEQNTGAELAGQLNLANRVAALCEREIRLKKWRIKKGYPQCSLCQEPVNLLHGTGKHCMQCFYRSQNQNAY